MNWRIFLTLSVLFYFTTQVPTAAYAQDRVKVTGVKTPKLFIFLDEKTNTPTPIPKPSDPVKEITDATCCNARMMVHLTAPDGKGGKITGWVLMQHLAIDGSGKKLTAGCNQQVAGVQVGSTRGLGEDCN